MKFSNRSVVSIYVMVSIVFVLLFVAISFGTSRSDKIRQIDVRNFVYRWDHPDDSDHTAWYWTEIPQASKVRLINEKHRFTLPEAQDVSPALRFSFAVYRDLDGDGIEEAAVGLNYTTGGTMNWEYLYVFKLMNGRLTLLGRLRSGSRADGGLMRGSIQQGRLVLDFADAERRTGDCCSSGYTRIRYVWHDGKFVDSGQPERGDL